MPDGTAHTQLLLHVTPPVTHSCCSVQSTSTHLRQPGTDTGVVQRQSVVCCRVAVNYKRNCGNPAGRVQ
jgi:hypothetical protein